MSDTIPSISVVIPTKNRREWLRETIASVQSQSFSAWEVLVVDDGSTDGTQEMVQSLTEIEPRIRFARRERVPAGAPTCRNIGLSLSNAEYILFLDADDLLIPSCLETRIRALRSNPDLAYVVGECERFKTVPGDLGVKFGCGQEQYDFHRSLCMHYPWQTTAHLWKRTVFDKIGRWDESLKIGQDVDLMTRALVFGLPYRRLHTRDYYYRETLAGVGSGNNLLENQASHLRRVDNLRGLLEARGLLRGFTRRCMAGNYLWIGQNFLASGQTVEARRVWKHARNQQVVPWINYCIGLLLLRPYHARFRRILVPLAVLWLPRGYLIQPECSEMSSRFVDRRGGYRPVHCPHQRGMEDCIEAGVFAYGHWLKSYCQRIQHWWQRKLVGTGK